MLHTDKQTKERINEAELKLAESQKTTNELVKQKYDQLNALLTNLMQ